LIKTVSAVWGNGSARRAFTAGLARDARNATPIPIIPSRRCFSRPNPELGGLATNGATGTAAQQGRRVVSKDGAQDTKLADTCDDLFRADEADSVAEEAYDNAFEEAVGGGFGAFRVRTEYEDEEDDENEKQRIRIEPIYDADSSVFFDLNAKRQDKSDARHCFVLYSITREAYKAEFGDDPDSWPKEIHQYEFDWLTPDVVYIAEYYVVEDVRHTIRVFQAIDGTEERYSEEDFEADENLEEMLMASGAVEVRQKRARKRRIHKYLLSGNKVLDDLGYIAGKNIPIIPVYGKRWFVDNVERCMGHVRLAKDAQRLKNMQLSKLGEISALSSVEKPIVLPEQVAGHQVMWAEDNLKNYPYLLINPITDQNGQQAASGPVAYTRSAQIPPAMAALLQLTEADMADILGNQQQAEKMVSNISGKAVELIQSRIDMQAFIYMSNMAKAVRRLGEVWLSIAREIYVEPKRKMKSLDMMGEVGSVELVTPMIDQKTGELYMENDLSRANFDVVVDVGPTSTSRREATVRSLLSLLQVTNDEQTSRVIQSMILMNLEGDGIGEMRDFFRKQLVQLGVIKPTEEEVQEMMAAMQNQQPDPNAVFLQAAAEEATAKAAKARADVVETLADAEYRRAKTVETLASVDLEAQKTGFEIAKEAANVPVQPSELERVISQYGPIEAASMAQQPVPPEMVEGLAEIPAPPEQQ